MARPAIGYAQAMKSTMFRLVLAAAAGAILLPALIAAQELTGSLIGTVKDAQGGVLKDAVARVSSPALIGGPITLKTNEKGQLRFPVLPPGSYSLDVELEGFAPYHEAAIPIGVNATIGRGWPPSVTVKSAAVNPRTGRRSLSNTETST